MRRFTIRRGSGRSRMSGTGWGCLLGAGLGVTLWGGLCGGLSAQQPPTSYSPVVMSQTFEQTVAKMTAAKAEIAERHRKLLE